MGLKLDWQVGNDDDYGPETRRQRLPTSSLMTFLAVILVVIIGLAIWRVYQQRQERQEQALKDQVQAILTHENQAYLAGDGERLLTNLTDDPSWRSAQLLPINQQVHRAGQTVTDVTEYGQEIWASVSWHNGAQEIQRVAFFERLNETLHHAPTSEAYWGIVRRMRFDWGELAFHEADESLVDEIGRFIGTVLAEGCPKPCPVTELSVILADDFQPSLKQYQVRLPSPRLIGLDTEGRSSPLFWQQLRQALLAEITPPVIRFAVPDDLLSEYLVLAADFLVENPHLNVEIISLDSLPPDPRQWPDDIDGAAMTPSAEMLAAGLVLDLTPYASEDPGFDQADFYDQIWQGAWWQERMWFMPQMARMQLLFYDREAYGQAELAEPSMRWTWEEMTADLERLAAGLPNGNQEWAFLDAGPDILFAYAFDQAGRCSGPAGSGPCPELPQPAAIAAALAWYQRLADQPDGMPDLSNLDTEQRAFEVLNLVSPRKVVIWVEEPVLYEHHLLLQPLGLVPFPGSERFDGVTPLWVQGNFISQWSQQPLATWEWLKFLSYHNLQRQKRFIPARPSVAADSGYWAILPRPVGEAMRAAFPFARAVRLDEQHLFGWDLLRPLLSGEASPAEVAQTRRAVRWFQTGE